MGWDWSVRYESSVVSTVGGFPSVCIRSALPIPLSPLRSMSGDSTTYTHGNGTTAPTDTGEQEPSPGLALRLQSTSEASHQSQKPLAIRRRRLSAAPALPSTASCGMSAERSHSQAQRTREHARDGAKRCIGCIGLVPTVELQRRVTKSLAPSEAQGVVHDMTFRTRRTCSRGQSLDVAAAPRNSRPGGNTMRMSPDFRYC
jgi:hypothetical protein